ncbi:MAG: 4-(cytidine 5'-diphospho)-2-C-methyl-D-erythritol kinase [Succinivibrio sp.]|nr:4-(cytidine 5'-diphospho)-2-C-methyl-D-erythritol kinase [Succinivibrio sp.]
MNFQCISPCKLNLFLYITGKRPDGYHNLQTLFVILNYGDSMTFETVSDDVITLSDVFDFPVKDNLIYKAAALLKNYCAIRSGVRIDIKKVLPQGGGLGGGSGNAATTLLVLNRLWHCNLDEATLIKLGTSLGADVPVFIKGVTAFGEGIGEILTEVSYENKWYLVCTPEGCHVPTPKLFSHKDLKKDSPVYSFDQLMNRPFENCFTKVVTGEYPKVRELLCYLSQFGPAFMSGSGSSCFVPFADEDQARRAYYAVTKSKIPAFVAKAVDRSPVLVALDTLQ